MCVCRQPSYYYGHQALPRYQSMFVVRRTFVCYTCFMPHYYYDDRNRRCSGHIECKNAQQFTLPYFYDRYELTLTTTLPSGNRGVFSSKKALFDESNQWPITMKIHELIIYESTITADGGLAAGGAAGTGGSGGFAADTDDPWAEDPRSRPAFVVWTTQEKSFAHVAATNCGLYAALFFFLTVCLLMCGACRGR